MALNSDLAQIFQQKVLRSTAGAANRLTKEQGRASCNPGTRENISKNAMKDLSIRQFGSGANARN
jgi:hypothetical protein